MTYNRELALRLPNRYRCTQAENVLSLYRRALAEQEDGSVEFIAIGPLNNLSELLHSTPDVYSPLSGCELIKRKVSCLTAMAGVFRCDSAAMCKQAEQISGSRIEEMKEFNVVCDILAAQDVAENWPTPKAYVGFEAGLIETGGRLRMHPDPNHPVKLAYSLYTENGSRYSWDLLTVEYAIVACCAHFRKSRAGHVSFDAEGRTHWKESEEGEDRYIELAKEPALIAKELDDLLYSGGTVEIDHLERK